MVIIANQFIGDKVTTGGDVLFLEICKRLNQKKTVLIPPGPVESIKAIFKEDEIVITDSRANFDTASTLLGGAATVCRYAIRTFNSSIWLLKNSSTVGTIYLTGDFICNTLPAAIYKIFHPRVKILANFYHRNPRPENRPGNPYLVSYFSRLLQGISLQIMRLISDTTFVLSEIGRNELLKEGYKPSSIVMSGAGVTRTKSVCSVKKKRNQIVFIGRINVTKGSFDLIEIISEVVKKNADIKLVMIGGGSDHDIERLKNLISIFKLQKNVSYLGFVDEATKNKILSESKVLILPSKEEGFGIVIMEAISLGTPVVCYDLPALKSTYSGYNSVNFVKSFNGEKFADTIRKAVTKKSNIDRRPVTGWDDVYKIQSKYLK